MDLLAEDISRSFLRFLINLMYYLAPDDYIYIYIHIYIYIYIYIACLGCKNPMKITDLLTEDAWRI